MKSHKFVSATMGDYCFCEHCGLSLPLICLSRKALQKWELPECKLSPEQLDATQVPNQSVDGSNPSWEDTNIAFESWYKTIDEWSNFGNQRVDAKTGWFAANLWRNDD